ncbi:hypothetical protein E2K98_19640 [Bacillus salipaludis]|uniref:Uncharacterized protein n=1 Tax=Bacillus salipaludis TaxID=2547811 RepID=A0A4R5VML7_9BACI|nr:hypothetical protein [Bacillus salipaludis]TDK59437.1 hypothetical protein E2K98_19640 [Bacillus salipaludis]
MDKNKYGQKNMEDAGHRVGLAPYYLNDREVEKGKNDDDPAQDRTERDVKDSLEQNGSRESEKQNGTSGYNIESLSSERS